MTTVSSMPYLPTVKSAFLCLLSQFFFKHTLSHTTRSTLYSLATDDAKLREVFGAFGEVTDVFLPTDHATSRPRGFGFVTLSSRAAAEEAIAKMDQSQLDSRTIRVNESRPRGEGPGGGRGPGGSGGFNASGASEVKLYVGNLSFDTPQESVRSHFEKFGEVTDCFMPTDKETGKVRGFAFVSMPAAEAEKACEEMNGAEIDGRTLKVNEAQPKGNGRSRGGFGGGGGYGGRGGGGYDDRGGGYDGGYNGGGGGTFYFYIILYVFHFSIFPHTPFL